MKKAVTQLLSTTLFFTTVVVGTADELSDFEDARSVWDSVDHNEYGFSFRRNCFCIPDYGAPMRVNVENNTKTSVTMWAGETALEDSASTVQTIDQLFDEIQKSIENGVCSVDVVYNDQWGYPEDISIDYDCRMADEEYYVQIENVTLYSALETEFEEAQSPWESAAIHTYNYLYSRYDGAAVEVEAGVAVINGVVMAAIESGTTAWYDNDQIPTVMDLFDLIREALDEKAFQVEVEYDETLGYPSRIFIDYDYHVTGDEVLVMVASVATEFTTATSRQTDVMRTSSSATALEAPTDPYNNNNSGAAPSTLLFCSSVVLLSSLGAYINYELVD